MGLGGCGAWPPRVTGGGGQTPWRDPHHSLDLSAPGRVPWEFWGGEPGFRVWRRVQKGHQVNCGLCSSPSTAKGHCEPHHQGCGWAGGPRSLRSCPVSTSFLSVEAWREPPNTQSPFRASPCLTEKPALGLRGWCPGGQVLGQGTSSLAGKQAVQLGSCSNWGPSLMLLRVAGRTAYLPPLPPQTSWP